MKPRTFQNLLSLPVLQGAKALPCPPKRGWWQSPGTGWASLRFSLGLIVGGGVAAPPDLASRPASLTVVLPREALAE